MGKAIKKLSKEEQRQVKEIKKLIQKHRDFDSSSLSECNMQLFNGYARACMMFNRKVIEEEMSGILAITSVIHQLFPIVQKMAEAAGVTGDKSKTIRKLEILIPGVDFEAEPGDTVVN